MKNHSRLMVMTGVVLIGIVLWPGLRPRRVAAQSVGLSGSYGFTLTSTWAGGDLPGANIGVVTFDGAGNFTGNLTGVQVAADPKASAPQEQSASFGGTYTVNADGTGTLMEPEGLKILFVITDGGSGLMLLPSAGFGNHLLTGTARKQ